MGIVEVNGVRGDTKSMIKRFLEDSKLDIVISRSNPFKIKIKQTSAMGLRPSLNRAMTGRSVLVLELSELLQEWNVTHPDKKVKKHDRFVSVNGRQGEAAKIMDQVEKVKDLDIMVARPRLSPRQG